MKQEEGGFAAALFLRLNMKLRLEQPEHVHRNRRSEGQQFSCDRVRHAQSVGVQSRTGNQRRILYPVQPVTSQRTSQRGHVHTQLVGAAGFRQQTQKRQAIFLR